MNFIEKTRVIKRVDLLIRLKATGSPSDLAEKLKVSRSTVYEIIQCMKDLNADIEYCKIRRSFYYTEEKSFKFGFFANDKIGGGLSNTYSTFYNFIQTPNSFPNEAMYYYF